MNYVVDYSKPGSLLMIPQAGVKQCCLPKLTSHNASWDSILTPEGKLFFSLCSELTTGEYAKLAEYRYDSNTVIEHFYVKDVVLPHERYIRDSKFHTSLDIKNDGALIMTTHTTDKSPFHPAWMPEAYFSNPWEGFPGSTLFQYDPKTKALANRGIPAPRESIYGAKYDPRNDRYYMLGFMRGHLYCYDCTSGLAEDMGQVTERHTYRMIRGADGNIYFSTRSGILQRILVDEKHVENLGIHLPDSSDKLHLARSYLCAGANGPDGRLYMAGQFHNEISVFDPASGQFEISGCFMEEDAFMEKPSNNAYIGAMAFDGEGILWYLVNCLRHDRKEDFKPPAVLMRWDILKNKAPQRIGLAGTPDRAITTSVGLFIDKSRDILYMVGTNHADEGPDITAVDLKAFRKCLDIPGKKCADPFVFPGNKVYCAHAENLARTWGLIDANPALATFQKIIPVRLWAADVKYAPEETGVTSVVWEKDTLHGICAGEKELVFQIDSSGTLRSFKPLREYDDAYITWLLSAVAKPGENVPCGLNLPYYPGRQYLALPDIACKLTDETILVSTKDGLLSLYRRGHGVYALGPVCTHGQVRAMTAVPGNRVFGIAGDNEDLGCIFTYDDTRGLRNWGRLATDGYTYGNAASCELSCLDYNRRSSILAVGARDRLGCVYLCGGAEELFDG
jgi:hypothetical protein